MAASSNRLRGALLATTALVAGAGGAVPLESTAFAQNILPTNGLVTSGAASIRQSGANLSVTQSTSRAIVNWGSFSIGPANGVTFDQPSASSAILNRVTGSTTSAIAGQLQANGQVYLVNPNGIAITKTGAVQVGGGFVASTLGIADNDFNNGNLNFVGKGASAGVSNAGSIAAAPGGFVGLLGGTVTNSGVVSVPLGKVAMGSGEQATLNLTGDNFLQVAMPTNTKTADGQALIDVSGKVRAAGGSVQLRAATVAQAIRNAVNVPGELSVTSARASGGSILLGGGPGGDVSVTGRLRASGRTAGGTIAIGGHDVALRQAKLVASSAKGKGGTVTVTGTHAVSLASSLVYASGATGGGAIRIGGDFHGASDLTSAQTTTIDSASKLNVSATGSGDGGTVAVWSDATANFAGRITATGGQDGGNGGYAEVSANPATHGVLTYSGLTDLTAPKGKTGTLLLDPSDMIFPGPLFLASNLTANAPGGTVTFQGTVDTGASTTCVGGCDVTVSASTINFGGAWGGVSALGAVSLTSTNSMTLPAITATRDVTVSAGGFADIVLGANVTTDGGAIAFNSPVQIGGIVSVNSGTAGTVTFKSTVDSTPGFSGIACADCELTVSGGGVTFGGNVGSTAPLNLLSVTGATTLAGNVTTTGDITFNSPIQLQGNVTANAGAGSVGFQSVDSAPAFPSSGLTVNAGEIFLGGALGGINPLGAVTFNNPVQIDGVVSVNAGTVTFKSTVDSTPGFSGIACADCELTVSGGGVTFGGNVGSTNPLIALFVTGPTTLAGNVTTTGAGGIDFNGPLQLQGNVTANAGAGSVGFQSVDSAPAFPSSGLTVNAGEIFLGGALGGINPLGAVTFNDPVQLLANVAVNAGDKNITFGSTVDTGSSTSCGAGCNLTVSGGGVTFGGNIGSVTPLGTLFVTGPTTLFGNVTTAGGAITFSNPVQIGGIVSVNSGAAGTVTFKSTVDSTPGFSGIACADCELTVSGGGVTFGGNVGSTAPLNLLSVTGATTLAGNVTTTGDITFNSPLQLQNTVTVNSGAGTVAFDSTVDSAPAFPSSGLTVNAGEIFLGGPLGGTNPLGAVSLTQTGGSLFLPSITATGNITLTGGAAAGPFNPIELTGNISTSGGGAAFNSAVGVQSNVSVSAPNGAVTFGSTVDRGFSSSCGVACDLTVSASTINFGGALGGLDQLDTVSLTSTDAMTLPSINAGALSATSTAGGIRLSGPLIVAGTAALDAAGDVVQAAGATIDPTNLSIVSTTGGITLHSTVNASESVTLSAANDIIEISGPPFGPVVVPSGSIVTPTLSATSTAGRVVLTLSNTVDSVSGSAPGGFSFFNSSALDVGNAGLTSSAGAIALETTTGSITQTGPVRGLALFAFAAPDGPAGDVTLNNPNNAVVTLAGGATGNFQFTNNNGADLAIGTVNYFVSSETEAPDTSEFFGVLAVRPILAGPLIEISNVGNLVLNSADPNFPGVPAVRSLAPAPLFILAATGNFTNNFGPDAISFGPIPNGNWQIYSASPTGDFFNGLDSGNTAVWNTTFGQTVTATGDRYIFAFRPTITVTSGDLAKTYGQDVTSLVAGDFMISGLQPGVAQAFNPDTAAAVYSGEPSVTSLGSAARAAVAGSPYPIAVAPGAFAVSDNYALVLDSAGRLTIDPLALTYAVADARSTYGTTPILGAATLSGVLPGDAVDPTVGAFSGTTAVAIGPRTPAGAYSEEVTALSNSNYSVALSGNTPGTLTIDPLAITFSVADASSIFGTTPILGPATLFGVLPGDAVIPTVDAFLGAAPIALSPFTPVGRYAQLVTAISNPNYRIAPGPNFPGVLTVSAPTANPGAPSDPGFLPGLTQINNPAQTEYDVGGYEQVLPHFTVACNEPPSLPDPNRFSDPDQALRAISQSMENYFRRCKNPTQSTIGDALDEYAAKLQILAPRLPPALRNIPAIVAQGAQRVRAARSRTEAVAVLRQTVAAVHKEIALVLSDDPQTRSREVRDGDVIAGALGGASVALVNSGSL